MSYELNNQKLNRNFITPIQLAFFGSIGIHVLIYIYGFPQQLFKNKTSVEEGIVSTIELNEIEKARLPDLETRWTVPEIPNTDLDEVAPPFAFPNTIAPLGKIPTNLPSIPIPSVPNFKIPISTDIKLPPISDLSNLPTPPKVQDLDKLVPPTPPKKDPVKPPEQKTPTETKTPITPPEQTKKPEEKSTPKPVPLTREEKLARELRERAKALRSKANGTTNEEARKNYVDWLNKVKQVEPVAIVLNVTYPRDACIRRLEGTSVYGVVVSDKGLVVGSELIKSAKYPIFNQQAIKDIGKYNFNNNTGNPKPYRVTANYKYDPKICPSLSLPPRNTKPKIEIPKKPVSTPVKPETPKKPLPTPVKPETPKKPVSTPVKPETPKKPLPTPVKPETPKKPVSTPVKPKTPKKTPLPPLRERLRNTPLPDNNTIRERLRNTPLPPKK